MIAAQPSRTAQRVALRRAAHQLVDAQPLVFADRFAVGILGPEAQEELRRTPKAAARPFSASLRAWVVARARFADDIIKDALAGGAGVEQYLVLGAGLDTFALRHPYPWLKVFEVDHPATQAWKRERLAGAGMALPDNARLVPVDFERQRLPQALAEAGFDAARPTCTAWLGVVPYLTAEAFAATCAFLGSLPRGSEVVFDYGQPREALPPEEQLMHDSLGSRVAQVGEPFQLFFTPDTLRRELEGSGLAVADDLGGAELNERYFHGREDGLRILGSGGRLCHVRVS